MSNAVVRKPQALPKYYTVVLLPVTLVVSE